MIDLDLTKQLQNKHLAPAPQVCELVHGTLRFDEKYYSGHPRQGVYKYFGGGELIVAHHCAPCAYKVPADVLHDFGGYHSRSVVLLQRSFDGGQTWPIDQDAVLYDETKQPEEKRAFLKSAPTDRPAMDMFAPDSVFFFGRTFFSDADPSALACFALRSSDRGRTWEKTPTLVRHPYEEGGRVHKDCHPVVRMTDGRTLLAAMTIGGHRQGVVIYRSTDQGLTWRFLSHVQPATMTAGRFTYAGLLACSDDSLRCYSLHIADDGHVEGARNAICMFSSTDGGTVWSDPTPIVSGGRSCWNQEGSAGMRYRSPWAMWLHGGRILMVFARRRLPMGLGAIVSDDCGNTWSSEFVIRQDAVCPDLGYPVGCQLDDGRIFIAYYYTKQDANGFGGTRHIACSHFQN